MSSWSEVFALDGSVKDGWLTKVARLLTLGDTVLLDADPRKDFKNMQTNWRAVKGGWEFGPEYLRQG